MAGNNKRNLCVGESSNDESKRREWLIEFDQKKIGVKHLADNLGEVPDAFRSQSPTRTMYTEAYNDILIPIINMRLPERYLVEQIKHASRKLGYFHIIDHGIPQGVCNELLQKLRAFYDGLVPSDRKIYYKRDESQTYNKGLFYNTAHDLPNGQVPTWHDTLYIRFGPDGCGYLPLICEDQIKDWKKKTDELAVKIGSLLAQGLGLSSDTFSEMLSRVGFFGNFYPHCPEPDKVLGFQPHSDPGLFTILVQDDSGGLQGLYNENWYDIKPVGGTLVVFIGDLLEILSNGVYQSGVHRVKSSLSGRTRVSVAQTFSPPKEHKTYAPFTHLGPLKYDPVDIHEYIEDFFNSKLTIKTMANKYRKDKRPINRHPSTRLCLGPPGTTL